MQKIKLWFGISRPKTFFASLCPVAVALLLVQIPRPLAGILTLLCALSLQVLSNFINDYYDFVRGSDKAGRVGPARALAEGLVTKNAMKRACLIALGVALATGLVLVVQGGWPILAIGLLSILFAWLYTATRHSLSYLGIADIFCFLFYGPIATGGTAFLQTGCWDTQSILAGIANGCIAVCVLATNNIRDIEDDRAAGKRTFPVRFGKKAALVGTAIMLLGAQAAMISATRSFFMLFWALIAIYVYRELCRANGMAYNRCLYHFGLTNLGYVLLVAVKITADLIFATI